MKAWELIKHLEEGGEIKEMGREEVFNWDKFNHTKNSSHIAHFMFNPHFWKIVKPKKKIKLYRYTIRRKIGTYYQTRWVSAEFNGPDFDNLVDVMVGDTRIKTEEKEIETED